MISIYGPPAAARTSSAKGRKTWFETVEAMQTALDTYVAHDNERRLRHGRHHGDRRITRLPRSNCQAITLSVHPAQRDATRAAFLRLHARILHLS